MPPILRMLRKAGYHDAFQVAGKGRGYTFPSPAPMVRIDYVFFPNRWAYGLREVHALNLAGVRQASDHRPVVAEWDWLGAESFVPPSAEGAGVDRESPDL
jgi:endonuclease/exonuclease/phosphatase family metal-dependent hydrolase